MKSDDEKTVGAIERIELTLTHHQGAVMELDRDVKRLTELVADHGRLLEGIERRQRVESGTLDAHERRITALEVARDHA